ncbi:hypothetical protein PI27_gp121 [Listeria phage WIL-1]|nr:hypothetical protein PI27_gp121 [Listeria phage WIL-1]
MYQINQGLDGLHRRALCCPLNGSFGRKLYFVLKFHSFYRKQTLFLS